MKFSKNELTAALKKAFEGIGFGVGDYEDAAAMVTWLETHGLQGLVQLHNALPHLMERPHPQIGVIQDDENLSILDARGGSTLICGSQAVDLAYAKAHNVGFGAVQLINCHNRKMIIERLVNTARRGMACVAYWHAHDSSAEYSVVSIEAHAEHPTYLEYAAAGSEVETEQSMIILCGSRLAVLQEYVADVLPASSGNLVSVTPEGMKSSRQCALEHGIDMDVTLSNLLGTLIKNVLVEATETSRAGAGE
ncbi:MAG: Ldh family oxidoreductase [Pseudomonadales bacterium]